MTEPLTREQLILWRRAIEVETLTGWPVEKVALIDTALHYEARSRKACELLGAAQNRLREVEAELYQQWSANHFEHCQRDEKHEGDCHWPLPALLQKRTL